MRQAVIHRESYQCVPAFTSVAGGRQIKALPAYRLAVSVCPLWRVMKLWLFPIWLDSQPVCGWASSPGGCWVRMHEFEFGSTCAIGYRTRKDGGTLIKTTNS